MVVESVLLYYKYVNLRQERDSVFDWINDLCCKLDLKGRIRVAYDGLNVTVGGSLTALQEHIAAVSSHQLLGGDIDFKLAHSEGPCSEGTKHDSGFNTFSIKKCKELVTLGPLAQQQAAPVSSAAQLLSPAEFHHMLQEGIAGAAAPEGTVLLDARNVYESRIGYFQVDGVPLLLPRTRCFSDLPAWMDAHQDALRGKRVLMYCTGGVRCERASAYLREKGPAFADVYQLRGGIQRYLEAYPDGGFFQGKNFVYDERSAVGASDSSSVVGSCSACGSPCDDYGARYRCSACRMLLLVCETCVAGGADATLQHRLLCELCLERGAAQQTQHDVQAGMASAMPPSKKLRILCLHGFRQTAKQFQGRTNALRKKLKDLADFVFVDGPYQLPPCSKTAPVTASTASGRHDPGISESAAGSNHSGELPAATHTLHNECGREEHTTVNDGDCVAAVSEGRHVVSAAEGAAVAAGAVSAAAGCLDDGEWIGGGEAGVSPAWEDEVASSNGQCTGDAPTSIERRGAARRAWLLSPELLQASQDESGAPPAALAAPSRLECLAGRAAAAWCGPQEYAPEAQLQHQTQGWAGTLGLLQQLLLEQGPFDGVLGFSQGAAVAAALCAQQQCLLGLGGSPQHREGSLVGNNTRMNDACAGPQHLAHTELPNVPDNAAALLVEYPPCKPAEATECTGVECVALVAAKECHTGPAPGMQPCSRAAVEQLADMPHGAAAEPTHNAAASRDLHSTAATQHSTAGPSTADEIAAGGSPSMSSSWPHTWRLRFAILASGYVSRAPEIRALLQHDGALRIPSLHIFGIDGQDRQVSREESEELCRAFEASTASVLRHTSGHIIPVSKSHIAAMRAFLTKAMPDHD